MLSILIIVIVAIYFVKIVFMAMSIAAYKNFTPTGQQVSASIIIPFRNEKENLPALCAALDKQDGMHVPVEIIFIDDQSTDNGALNISSIHPHRIVRLSGEKGKKAAIAAGIRETKYDYIITLDADVIPPSTWLSTVCDALGSERVDLLILPVEILPGEKIIEDLQATEFLNIQGITAGSAIHGHANMCNGANLAFRKNVWMEAQAGRTDHHIASGDDMFLLHEVKKNGVVNWLHTTKAMVRTRALGNWKDLLQQRIRWSAKSKYFKDKDTLFTGIIVMALHLALFYGLLLALTKTGTWATFFWIITAKTMAEFTLLTVMARWTGRTKLIAYLPVMMIFHPVYVAVVAIGSLIAKPVWKDRKI